MNRRHKVGLVLAMISLLTGGFWSCGWAQWEREDPIRDEYAAFDIVAARPIGIVATIVGSGLFVVSLPFTIPTRSVKTAADMFIVDPFRFSFVRAFPDGDIP